MRAGADPRSVVPYGGSANKNRRLIFYRCLEPARSFKKRENWEQGKNGTQKLSVRQVRTHLRCQRTKDPDAEGPKRQRGHQRGRKKSRTRGVSDKDAVYLCN